MLQKIRSHKKVFLGVLIFGFLGVSAYELYSTRPSLVLSYDRPSNYRHDHIFGECELKPGHESLLDISLFKAPRQYVQSNVSFDSEKWNLDCVKSIAEEINSEDGFAQPLLMTTVEVLLKSREYDTSLVCEAHQIKHKYFVVQTAPKKGTNFNQSLQNALLKNAIELDENGSSCEALEAGANIISYKENILVSDEFKMEAVSNSYDTSVALRALSVHFIRDQRISSKNWVSTIGKSTIFLIACLLILVA